MKHKREISSRFPMMIGLVIAAITHLVLLPMATQRMLDSHSPQRHQLDHDRDTHETRLGQDRFQRSSVAWIAYKDFQKLIAPKSKTIQPALQKLVDPQAGPKASVAPDPPSDASEAISVIPDPSPSLKADTQSLPESRGVTPALPVTNASMVKLEPLKATQADRSTRPTNAPTRRRTESRPTPIPRSDKESSPATLSLRDRRIRPGGVIAGQGIEIKTVQPRFSAVTLASVMPRNPVAKVVFNHQDGRVIKAYLIRSSGYPNVDGPVLASLYQWRAAGDRLKRLKKPFEIRLELLLVH